MTIRVFFKFILSCLMVGLVSCQSEKYISVNNSELVFEDSYGFELVENLKSGKYFVYKKYPCDSVDILITGVVKKRKRTGDWKYYKQEQIFDCKSLEAELVKIKTYENGNLILRRDYWNTELEIFYRGVSPNEDQDWTKKIYRKNGQIVMVDTLIGRMTFRKEFGEDGLLTTELEYLDDLIGVKEYDANGVKVAEYQLIEILKDGKYEQSRDGVWRVWDENGNLVEEKLYERGVELSKME